MSNQLAGKSVLVTGGSRGIGAAICKRFAAEGAQVAVNYHGSQEAAEKIVVEIKEAGGEAVAIKASVDKPQDVERLFAETKRAFGKLDILVNNAGVMQRAHLDEVTPEQIDTMFGVNVKGMLLCAQQAARLIPRGGSILNVSSAISRMAYPGSVVYSSTKGAIDVMTRVLAMELGPQGIRVNAINPGSTETDMNSAKSGKTKEEEEQEKELTALGRIGQPEDIADAALLLVVDDARWVTGTLMDCSGGLRL